MSNFNRLPGPSARDHNTEIIQTQIWNMIAKGKGVKPFYVTSVQIIKESFKRQEAYSLYKLSHNSSDQRPAQRNQSSL